MNPASENQWYVYILECSDHSLYTGCTNNLAKRLSAHNSGKGAKYTKAKLPVHLLYAEPATDRSQAQKREAEIKKLSRTDKLSLVEKYSEKNFFRKPKEK
jgi:putative endonuclease